MGAGGKLTLKNVQLKHGATDGSGGALLVQAGGIARLTNCAISQNFAFQNGGAIYNLGILQLLDCKLAGNEAQQGGTIANFGTLALVEASSPTTRPNKGAASIISTAPPGSPRLCWPTTQPSGKGAASSMRPI